MAITQSRIPFGYGYCIIRFSDTDADDTADRGFVFAVDTNNFPEIEEVKHEATTIFNVRKKHCDQVHLSFTLRLREDNTLTNTTGYCDSDAILRFLTGYYKQRASDQSLFLTPAGATTGSNFNFVPNVNTWIVIVDKISLVNVVDDTRGKGQELVLQCRTKYPINVEDWKMVHRYTVNDNFYTAIGSESNYGDAVSDNIYFES